MPEQATTITVGPGGVVLPQDTAAHCEMRHRANLTARVYLLEGALRNVMVEAGHAVRNRVGPHPQDVALTRESLLTIETTARLALGEARSCPTS